MNRVPITTDSKPITFRLLYCFPVGYRIDDMNGNCAIPRNSMSSITEYVAKNYEILFVVLFAINFLNYLDRGIIPGATDEFNDFVSTHVDTSTPDVYLGILQSSFIVGFCIASLIFGHMINYCSPFFLCGLGMSIWSVAVVGCGCAYYANSFGLLVFARICSGVGEASVQCSIPPFIAEHAPKESKGFWLSIFYTAIPVGTAMGYSYSSAVAANLGWQFCFFIEALAMIPFIVLLFGLVPHFPFKSGSHPTYEPVSREESSRESQKDPSNEFSKSFVSLTRSHTWSNSPTSGPAPSPRRAVSGEPIPLRARIESVAVESGVFMEELMCILQSVVFWCLALGYAAQTGTLIGISTFGSSFLMGLGYFSTEEQASSVFGAVVSLAGIVSTPLGGMIVDYITKKQPAAVVRRPSAISPTVAATTTTEKSAVRKSVWGDELATESPMFVLTAQDTHVDSYDDRLTASDDSEETGPGGSSEEEDLPVEALPSILRFICIATAFGLLFLVLLYFIRPLSLFIIVVTCGCGIIFLCSAGINMAIMLCVPPALRSLAIGINSIILHLFGDVPSPIIVGLIKDSLAPDCVGAADNSTSDACREEASGIRLTMLLTSLWLCWTVLLFGIAWLYCSTSLSDQEDGTAAHHPVFGTRQPAHHRKSRTSREDSMAIL